MASYPSCRECGNDLTSSEEQEQELCFVCQENGKLPEIDTEARAREFVLGKCDVEALAYLSDIAKAEQKGCDLDHILSCLKSIVAQLFGFHPAGGFGQAVLKNDLMEAVGRADSTNVLCLNFYTTFLHNKVPSILLREARKR